MRQGRRTLMKGKEKILLVEKSLKRRKLLVNFLTSQALDIEESASFSDAANRIMNTTDFSIFVISSLDIESDKISLLRSIRSSNPYL